MLSLPRMEKKKKLILIFTEYLQSFRANCHIFELGKQSTKFLILYNEQLSGAQKTFLSGLRWFKCLKMKKKILILPANCIVLCNRHGPLLCLQLKTEYFQKETFAWKWQRTTKTLYSKPLQNQINFFHLLTSCRFISCKISVDEDTQYLAQDHTSK